MKKMLMLVMIMTILCSCQMQQSNDDLLLTTNAKIKETTNTSFPKYIVEVWPAHQSEINIDTYTASMGSSVRGGIGVRIYLVEVLRSFGGGSLDPQLNENNVYVSLYVDNQIVSIELLRVYDLLQLGTITDQDGNLLYEGSALYDYSWGVTLEPGIHEALAIIGSYATDDYLEFNWVFTILDE